jgi:hypothetical protein
MSNVRASAPTRSTLLSSPNVPPSPSLPALIAHSHSRDSSCAVSLSSHSFTRSAPTSSHSLAAPYPLTHSLRPIPALSLARALDLTGEGRDVAKIPELLAVVGTPTRWRVTHIVHSLQEEKGEEERGLINDLKRHGRLAVAWDRQVWVVTPCESRKEVWKRGGYGRG